MINIIKLKEGTTLYDALDENTLFASFDVDSDFEVEVINYNKVYRAFLIKYSPFDNPTEMDYMYMWVKEEDIEVIRC